MLSPDSATQVALGNRCGQRLPHLPPQRPRSAPVRDFPKKRNQHCRPHCGTWVPSGALFASLKVLLLLLVVVVFCLFCLLVWLFSFFFLLLRHLFVCLFSVVIFLRHYPLVNSKSLNFPVNSLLSRETWTWVSDQLRTGRYATLMCASGQLRTGCYEIWICYGSGPFWTGRYAIWICVSGQLWTGRYAIWICVSDQLRTGCYAIWICVSGQLMNRTLCNMDLWGIWSVMNRMLRNSLANRQQYLDDVFRLTTHFACD